MKKLINTLFIVTFLFSSITGVVFAQDSDKGGINFEGAVIDDRCTRERFADPEGPYARFCKLDENKELYIICLNKAFPEEQGFFGVFNLFKSRLRVTPETLPSLIRTVILVFFAVVGVTTFWMSVWGYYRWISTVNDSPDDAMKLWKFFTNGVFGLVFSLGALILTWGLFSALGVRKDNEDFFQIGEELAITLSMPCEDLGKDTTGTACRQFNYSCRIEGGVASREDETMSCVNAANDAKATTLRGMPGRVGTVDENGKFTYEGENPCSTYQKN